jgi:hypothetical protein
MLITLEALAAKSKAHKSSAAKKASRPKKKSSRSVFLKAFMSSLDGDVCDAYVSGNTKEFDHRFDELKGLLVEKMSAKK